MNAIASQLLSLVDEHYPSIASIPSHIMEHKPSPSRWSKREIIGHLVDSAQNNIRRFVLAQYEETPVIIYNQDQWAALANYQHRPDREIIDLWQLLNRQIVAILDHMPPSAWSRTCQTSEIHTIEWLATDYIKHLRHHLHQVLDLEPVAYP
jgi:hypothetical protein